ncbi:MAG TPA: serine protease [Micavibrio sp.]|nr:serine protease [Micavibrio sp.]HIL28192.1 serine protease [Micavibrio sp.]
MKKVRITAIFACRAAQKRHNKITMIRCIPLILLIVFLAGCGGLTVDKVPYRPILDVPQDSQPSPIGFREIRWMVPTGTPVLSQSPQGMFGFILCDWPYTQVEKGITSRSFPDDNFRQIFHDTMTGQGYDVTGDPGRFFNETEDMERTLYAIGGRVTDIKADTCKRTNLWGIDRGVRGEAHIEITWTVFDLLTRRTVYRTTTKGYGKLQSPNHEGVILLMEDAFAAAVHNLGADEEFHNMVFLGAEPQQAPLKQIQDIHEQPVTKFDPTEEVVIMGNDVSQKSVTGRLDNLKKAVVMVEAGGAHGSGFFITTDGHIITNAHVVGNAVRVRVVTSGKQEKLIGEVLRTDRARDVALIRLEDAAGLDITTLPLKTDKPAVGDDIYAIGAPRLKRLQDTVTKGIVSAHRYDRRRKKWFIQADVDIYGGNSGGPLLDGYGNVVGVAAEGYFVADETMGGLNHFIPIESALDALDIGLGGAARKTSVSIPSDNAPIDITP